MEAIARVEIFNKTVMRSYRRRGWSCRGRGLRREPSECTTGGGRAQVDQFGECTTPREQPVITGIGARDRAVMCFKK